MSGTSINAVNGASASYGLLGMIVTNSNSVHQQLNTLTEQASTGLVAESYAGLGGGAATSLVLAAAVADQNTWSSNIDAANGSMQVAQTALSQISSIASNFYAQANNLDGLDAGNVDIIAADARAALRQVAGLLDSTNGDVYVFAGQDSQNPPVPDPDGILASGFATRIAAAVGNLAAAGPAATIAATKAIAVSNAAGISPFSAALSKPAAALAGLRSTIQVGTAAQVPVGIIASANAAVASTGASTTGSYTRDIMRALATLGSLTSGMVATAGFSQLAADSQTGLGNAITALNADAGVMGDQQTQLTAQQTEISATTAALQGQISNAQDVNMASTLSQLQQVETQLQSSYQLIASVEGLSLTKFLPAA
jgi:flagellar hook-associated protein 3 FlgL